MRRMKSRRDRAIAAVPCILPLVVAALTSVACARGVDTSTSVAAAEPSSAQGGASEDASFDAAASDAGAYVPPLDAAPDVADDRCHVKRVAASRDCVRPDGVDDHACDARLTLPAGDASPEGLVFARYAAWGDQFRYFRCTDLTRCLWVDLGAGPDDCARVLLFAGRAQSTQDRVAAPSAPSAYFEGANVVAVADPSQTFTGATAYSGTTADRDLVRCIK